MSREVIGYQNPHSMPQNPEAEKATLGAILIDGTAINQVLAILDGGDFYSQAHRKIFYAMVELNQASKPIDTLSLFEHLKAKGQLLDEVGGSSYIAYLPETVPSATNVAYYAGLVREAAQKRRICRACQVVERAIKQGEMSHTEAISELTTMLERAEAKGAERLTPVRASELKPGKPMPSLWGGLFYPETITQINSEPGVGKTTFCYNLAVYGALGLPFLGVPFARRLKVLYVDRETPKHLIERKLRDILPNDVKDLPGNLHLLYELIFEDLTKLSRLCSTEHYDLIFFDTQSKVLGMADENDNAEANRKVVKLGNLCRERGCALVLIHHPSKSDRKGVYSGRGASAISASAGVVINIEALDEEVLRLLVSKNRFEGLCAPMCIRKIGDDRFKIHTSTETGLSGFEKFRAQDAILKLWSGHDASYNLKSGSIHDKMEAQGFSRRTSERALAGLRLSGKIRQTKRGVYSLTATSATSVHPSLCGSGGSGGKGFQGDVPEVLR